MSRIVRAGAAVLALALASPAAAASLTDADGNGYSDAGVQVVDSYTQEYVMGTTTCTLRVGYRGDFANTPYLDSGSISNHYLCKGPRGTQVWNYQIVHETDPRFRGNPDWVAWEGWEYHVLVQGGQHLPGGNGNLVRPYRG